MTQKALIMPTVIDPSLNKLYDACSLLVLLFCSLFDML